MIKKFFAKLVGWSQTRQHKEWEKMMVSKGQEIGRLAEDLVHDQKMMGSRSSWETSRNVLENERAGRSNENMEATSEKHDQAA